MLSTHVCTFLMGPQNHSCCPVHPRKWQENSSILHNHSSVSPDYCTNQPAPVLCIQKQIPVSVAILKENTVYCLGTSRAVPEEQLMAVAVRSEHLLFLSAISFASSFQTQLLLTPRYITDLDPFFCDTEKCQRGEAKRQSVCSSTSIRRCPGSLQGDQPGAAGSVQHVSTNKSLNPVIFPLPPFRG